MDWQPIETAPIDGTEFIGLHVGRIANPIGLAYRVQRDDCEMWHFAGQTGCVNKWPEKKLKPTHWIPKPPNPKS